MEFNQPRIVSYLRKNDKVIQITFGEESDRGIIKWNTPREDYLLDLNVHPDDIDAATQCEGMLLTPARSKTLPLIEIDTGIYKLTLEMSEEDAAFGAFFGVFPPSKGVQLRLMK